MKRLEELVKLASLLLGLVPTVAAYLKPLPLWFQVTPGLAPDATTAALVGSGIAYVLTLGIGWSGAHDPARQGRISGIAVAFAILAAIDFGAYAWFIRTYEGAGTWYDIVQIALWSAFFVFATIAVTLGCLLLYANLQRPRTQTRSGSP